MPTPKTVDDIPMTPIATGGGVSILAYLEARIRDQREHIGVELQGLREMLLRFREDTHAADNEIRRLVELQNAERDLRYAQRFEAQNIALKEASLAAEKAINAAMVAAEKAISAALTSAAQAVQKAEAASETRFQSVNEFRSQLGDQAATFIPRTEAAARFDSQAEKLDALSSRIDKSEGAGGGLKQGWAFLIGAVGLASSVIAIFVLTATRV